ncbi:TPA: hypothetical protein DIS56_02440 [Candidatus Saccharibacteria bacterium]|nr:MAG: FAD linked oxidase domain protein [Candidatus Saccharibacteria bacterium GW2011_GWA2_46_10]HCM51968.1 hypothetical protein [Candidatus Saccharibacteria bacterium]
MNKVAHYLQEHLLGEVTANAEVRRYFAHDGSILQMPPAMVVYPRSEEDVRKTASFCWQLVKRGQAIPITARGSGSNTSGGAIGPGILLIFPAHMNKILSFDAKRRNLTVEPGVTYSNIEQMLFSHGQFLPPYPPSQNYSTIGGAVAKNSLGEKSVKYGVTGHYVRSLRVVLANGEVIETGSLSKRELSQKMGLTNFEGEIYRALDKLLEENHEAIEESRGRFQNVRNTAGYNIFGVKSRDHFDLTPLIVGSQGSLGIICEVSLASVEHSPQTTLCLASIPKLESLHQLLPQIKHLRPSVLDFINRPALQLVSRINPNQLSGASADLDSEAHLFVEFDDIKKGRQKDALKALNKLIAEAEGSLVAYTDANDKDQIFKIRDSVATILNFAKVPAKAVPVAEDIAVPQDKIVEFIQQAYGLYQKIGLPPAAWGHIGDGVLHFQPLLDLSKLGDRQKLFRISDSFYSLAIKLGGSITAGAGDGRVRAPYLKLQYGDKLHGIMQAVKNIFDPYGILNPGVKTATPAQIKALMRSEYGPARHQEYLPRY